MIDDLDEIQLDYLMKLLHKELNKVKYSNTSDLNIIKNILKKFIFKKINLLESYLND